MSSGCMRSFCTPEGAIKTCSLEMESIHCQKSVAIAAIREEMIHFRLIEMPPPVPVTHPSE